VRRLPRNTVRAQALTPERKAGYTAALEALIAEMRQRYLPGIRPATNRNDPVDLRGRWRGENDSFVVRFRSGFPENAGEEFDPPFARLDHFGGEFAVMWMRHSGGWWCLRSELPFEAALAMVTTEPVLRPPV
jgi:hypothetical protein